MATTVSYKNNTLTTVNNTTHTLKTAGKYLEDDITLTDVTGSITEPSVYQDANGYLVLDDDGSSITIESLAVTSNNIYTAPAGKAYSPVTVNVPVGGIKVANGTFTGNGGFAIDIPIGEKMAQTDFYILIWANRDTTIPYIGGGNYKMVRIEQLVNKIFASYDLSANGDKINPTLVNSTYITTNSDNATTTTASLKVCPWVSSIRGTAMVYGEGSGHMRITRTNTGFKLYWTRGNSLYQFVSGIVYNYEIVYFGTSPETDIVEVSV